MKKGNPQSIESMMSGALLRSGYVMESKIGHSLVKSGFFVEPNQRTVDPSTKKSREIDLIAELWYSTHESSHFGMKANVNVRFVCEAKNNPYPIALLTELPQNKLKALTNRPFGAEKERMNPGILRALGTALGSTLATTGDIAQIWSPWRPAIKKSLGFMIIKNGIKNNCTESALKWASRWHPLLGLRYKHNTTSKGRRERTSFSQDHPGKGSRNTFAREAAILFRRNRTLHK
jgi:hypothetical protein